MLGYKEVAMIVNCWGIQLRKTRQVNLVLLVTGLLDSRSGCLSAIVRRWPTGARRHVHRLKRLHRFLKNEQVRVAELFPPLMGVVWRHRSRRRARLVPIIIDWTKVRQFHTLWAALPRRARALPLAFGVYHAATLRHSQNKLERGLCTAVASWLPDGYRPLFLGDMGFGRTEFVRWLQSIDAAFVIRLRPETHITYRGRTQPLGALDTAEGLPTLYSGVLYRGTKPVKVNIVVSRLGEKVWYLGTSFGDARRAVRWYEKRFWIEEMFRDFKSRLGLRCADLKDADRLARLLLGYQIAYLILALIAVHTPRRWRRYLCSRDRTGLAWLALNVLQLLHDRPRHRPLWRRRIWPVLLLQSG